VLTTKINELKRQAMQLSRTAWTGTLNVEPLNRALSIQYWTGRSTATGSKSWILVAVNSNRKRIGTEDASSTSQLVVKWYRDNKEVKDVEIAFSVNELSAEALLTDVIACHIEHILTSIHDKLLTAARFKNGEASMALHISKTDPAFSMLTTQVGNSGEAAVLLEPITGVFSLKPTSRFSMQPEHQLNSGKNPADDGLNCLESLRCAMMEDELQRRATMTGWFVRKPPMTAEDLKMVVKMRDWTRAIWLQLDGWGSSWFVVVVLSLTGDEWWLLES
jgi:mediator of RNA polymerase II transcription subunit 14